MKQKPYGGPLHRSGSPFINTITAVFHALSFDRNRGKQSEATRPESSPEPSKTYYHAPGPFPPGMTAEDVAQLAREDIADSERRAAREREIAARYVSVPSRRSESKSSFDFVSILLAPFFIPLGVGSMLTLVGGPVFMALSSRNLWIATYNRFTYQQPADLVITIAIVLGGSLVAGWLLGLLMSRILKPLKSFGLLLTMLIPLSVCVPILVAAWFYPIPTVVQYTAGTWFRLFSSIPYTRNAVYASPSLTAALSLTGAGWSYFIAAIRKA